MKQSTLLLLTVLQFNLYGQDVENRIKDIRTMYQQTVAEKDNYSTKEKDITWKAFSGEYDRYSKATAVSYYDVKKHLKLVKCMFSSSGQYSNFYSEAELYYNSDSLYFLYSVRKNTQWQEVYQQKGKSTSQTEERVYFGEDGKCIRYLYKEYNGKPEQIDSLQKVTPNQEFECMYSDEMVKRIEEYLED